LEDLVVFIIFIVVFIIRNLGRQFSQRPAAPPVRPAGDVQPPKPVRQWTIPPLSDRIPVWLQSVRPVLTDGEIAAPPPRSPEPLQWEQLTVPTEPVPFSLSLEADSVVLGVVFSEVLGRPRSQQKHRIFSGPAR